MPAGVDKVHLVFNRTKRPYLDQAHRIIIFNSARYRFPTPELYTAYSTRLNNAVDLLWSATAEQRDVSPVMQLLKELRPYKINNAIGPQYRQQNTIDAVTREIVN
jgi:hypothetical protein